MSFIALIDYDMGNLLSVSKALESVGANLRIVRHPIEAEKADALILPGVGNFGDGMKHLNENHFVPFIKDWIAAEKPFLGICLGMQMLMESSEEAPDVEGLGIFPGKVVRFPSHSLKVPHIGWNTIDVQNNNPYFQELSQTPWFYFVHSYYVQPEDSTIIAAQTNYIVDFAAALSCGNLLATQFHPEKSQENGLNVLKHFIQRIQ
ncbi:MAG: imidazole glycerol phosphate synthase subunit HisH [Planctomycetia bacterium]|nr:imidazole glycerol phosphate synthase subunit HisH [Planctomycetia bacterium]